MRILKQPSEIVAEKLPKPDNVNLVKPWQERRSEGQRPQ
jgi:hypothetical protein